MGVGRRFMVLRRLRFIFGKDKERWEGIRDLFFCAFLHWILFFCF